MFNFSNLDLAESVLGELNLEAQLLAIKSALHRNQQEYKAFLQSIKTLEERARRESGEYADHLVDLWVDDMHASVYLDAARSMSAVGMLAPLVESLFVAIFRGLQELENGETITEDIRALEPQEKFWNPHFVFRGEKYERDLVAGIEQLATSIGLIDSLPNGYGVTLKALFVYRNKMLHNGFEWPQSERSKFANCIRDNNWPDNWFSQSTINDDPWIFYLSDDFIEHCLETIDKILDGVGAYVREQKKIKPYSPS